MRMGSKTAPVHFRKWPAQSGHAPTLDYKFGKPKRARPRPSGIGGLQGQGRAGHASTRDLRNQFRFLTPVPCLSIIVPKSCRTKCASVRTDSDRTLSLASECRVVMSNSIAERPSCPTCKHRMGLTRISPGNRGLEERTFECSTCHWILKISFPVDPLKTDAVGWMASELRPPR